MHRYVHKMGFAAVVGSLLLLTACGVEGPAGPKGVGEAGPQGDAGPAGVDGGTGVAGADGVDGTDGTGTDGADGADGVDGVDGVDGNDGVDGVDYPGPAPAEYVAADGIRGGSAYSQWFYNYSNNTGSQTDYGVTVGSEFVRCKTCHGWDGLGTGGSYANRTGLSTGAASRPDVASVNLRAFVASSTYGELFDTILAPYGRTLNSASNGHPDFTTAMTNEQAWDLIKFMREEWVDPAELYTLTIAGAPTHREYSAATTSWVVVNPTLTYTNVGTDGNAANGETIYDAKCQGCHGATGNSISLGGQTLGALVRSKPNEPWFKLKFGNGSVSMPPAQVTSTTDLKDLYKALANSTNYP